MERLLKKPRLILELHLADLRKAVALLLPYDQQRRPSLPPARMLELAPPEGARWVGWGEGREGAGALGRCRVLPCAAPAWRHTLLHPPLPRPRPTPCSKYVLGGGWALPRLRRGGGGVAEVLCQVRRGAVLQQGDQGRGTGGKQGATAGLGCARKLSVHPGSQWGPLPPACPANFHPQPPSLPQECQAKDWQEEHRRCCASLAEWRASRAEYSQAAVGQASRAGRRC